MNRFHRTGLPLYALPNSRSEGFTVSGGTALGACLSASAIYNNYYSATGKVYLSPCAEFEIPVKIAKVLNLKKGWGGGR